MVTGPLEDAWASVAAGPLLRSLRHPAQCDADTQQPDHPCRVTLARAARHVHSSGMELQIRTAQAGDQGPIAELMYSSGTHIYDYLYGAKAVDFLRHEFASGRG